jgi:Uma2 family endonuclease
VAGDILWYPVEGEPGISLNPDALVSLGRPKRHRGSYRQWEEDNIPPQIVFEVLSPSNTAPEMRRKLGLYEKYGVQEYYEYDPDRVALKGWHRQVIN